MAAVSNSSPLILYARINRLGLLQALFTELLIPPAVWREVVTGGTGRSGAREVQQAGWIRRLPSPVQEIPRPLASLGLGEAEAITLASSIQPAVLILLDDHRARRMAQDAGLVVTGSGGLLGLAKEAGLIPSVRPILSDLRSAGLFISEAAVRELLEVAGEGSTAE